MNKLRQYFIGDILKKTDDAFEHARAILLLRFCLMFTAVFLLPVITDIILGYDKATIIHSIAFVLIFAFPLVIKKQQNIERSVNLFFAVTFVISFLIYMILVPSGLDAIGMSWGLFFLVLSALLQRGKMRLLFCCFLNWLPMLYVIANNKLNGALEWKLIIQEGAENPPIFLVFIPTVLSIYAVWTNASTVEQARMTITEQKKIIDEKNKDIIDSINYAKRLQNALLPSLDLINKELPHNFIYYKPKDIVAGDFFWFEKQNDLLFIAAADCTGHGVPGALVSVVCSGALTRTINELHIIQPNLILDKTRELILETFAKSNNEVKDGMDISLLCLDKKNKAAFWSGANNPLWYVQNKNLVEVKPNKQPIGKSDNPLPFTTHKIDCETETTFYLFTDGMADQFGGPKGKKYKYKQMQELLMQNHQLNLNLQKELLDKSFMDWKGKLEQVDDVCVIGIRV